MGDIEKKVEELDSLIQQKQAELEELYRKVNNLCEMFDIPHAKYEIKGQDKEIRHVKLKGDEYFRKPTATAITLILEDRKIRDMGPATVDEICEKMVEGGYIFEVQEPKKAVGTAMGKNPKFTRVGDTDKWGLTEWYPPPKGKQETINNEDEAIKQQLPKRRGRPPKTENKQKNESKEK